MTRKQLTNPILANPDNQGVHSTRRLKSVQTMMTTHGLKKAVVYQFILSGKSAKADYQATIKALIRHIRTQCRAEYIGAYEVGDEKGGLHCHCYIIIETAHQIPRYLLDVSEGHFIARRIKRTGMSIRIEPPKGKMHGGAMFAKMDTPAKLADCIAWVEYHIKGRSKAAVAGREVYFASEFASNATKREAKRQKYRDALLKSSVSPAPAAAQDAPDAKEDYKPHQGDGKPQSWVGIKLKPEPHQGAINASQTHNNDKGSDLKLTPAQSYLCRLYENCVDADMDVEAVRLYLLDQGIRKTPAMIVDDLEHTFGFLGYAASHKAPAKPDAAKIDALIAREHHNGNRKFGRYEAVSSALRNHSPKFQGSYSDRT